MNKHEQFIQLRSKKMGALLVDARLATCRSTDECAGAMGISTTQYQAFERGKQAPSLPQIEALAAFLNIPPDHFWGSQSLLKTKKAAGQDNRLHEIRNRIIGARLKQRRLERQVGLPQLAEQTAISEEQLKAYELGLVAVPVPELELLTRALGLKLEDLFDKQRVEARYRGSTVPASALNQLSPDLQNFISKPINQPYLQLAKRLSDLSVEKLRAIAEGLLEITY